jgi:hypothetical protein
MAILRGGSWERCWGFDEALATAISLVAFQVVAGWPRVGAAERCILWSEVLPEAQVAPKEAFCCAWLGHHL